MSKYSLLWEYIKKRNEFHIKLSFDQIREIAGIKIDHSFLQYKKELKEYGYQVERISLKEQNIVFTKVDEDQ
jgi:hypothetical protein